MQHPLSPMIYSFVIGAGAAVASIATARAKYSRASSVRPLIKTGSVLSRASRRHCSAFPRKCKESAISSPRVDQAGATALSVIVNGREQVDDKFNRTS